MLDTQRRRSLFALQITVGVAVWITISYIVGKRPLGEALGFFGMWLSGFPFARRTWAPGLPFWRYAGAGAAGAAIAGTFGIFLR